MIIFTLPNSLEKSSEVPVETYTLPSYTGRISISGDSQTAHKYFCVRCVHMCGYMCGRHVCGVACILMHTHAQRSYSNSDKQIYRTLVIYLPCVAIGGYKLNV